MSYFCKICGGIHPDTTACPQPVQLIYAPTKVGAGDGDTYVGCAQCNALQRTLLQVQGERDRIRQETLEECRYLAESMALYTGVDVATAIRALGEKP